jgi:hypothetical protein
MRLPGDGPAFPSAVDAWLADTKRRRPEIANAMLAVAELVARARRARSARARESAIAKATSSARAALELHAPTAPIPRPLPGTRDLGPILALTEAFRDKMPNLTEHIQRDLLEVHAALAGVAVGDLPDQEQAVQAAIGILEANEVSRADLGGLSPHDVSRIVADDWQGAGPVRLSPATVGWDRDRIFFLRIVDRILGWFDARDPVAVREGEIMPNELLQSLSNEVWAEEALAEDEAEEQLGVTALALRLSVDLGLVGRRKGKLSLTAEGRRMRRPESTPILYESLFVAYFQGLDVVAFDDFPERERALNASVAWVLHRIRDIARDWKPVDGVIRAAWPKAMREGPPRGITPGEHRQLQVAIFFWRVMAPLSMFGLVELRTRRRAQCRSTRLFHDFFSVDVGHADRGPGIRLM